MKIFQHANESWAGCPICGTKEDKPVVLIPMSESKTDSEGNIKATCFHVDCVNRILNERSYKEVQHD